MPEDYTDIAIFTRDDIQIVVRVADPKNQVQIQQAIEALFLGLSEISTLDEILGIQREAQKVIDTMRKKGDLL